ncbi:hypothetical protein LOK49_LG05G00372 [Camellia lanceoleosa]|uniref:Uncharacterized protein n=1 Tax=Camellia lanceoleosa TaxID=1840588 RepID=A0ACC0HLD5_9ERIC|nr:hypothetical protein LOK49_LG05G00372 [Camellia lanceoleosa]
MLHAVHFLIELCGMMLFIMSNELMLFRFLIFATWILPFAGPLLIGTVANNLVIKDPENKKVKAMDRNAIFVVTVNFWFIYHVKF